MRKFPLSYGVHYEDALGFGVGGRGEGELQENFENDALFLAGTEKWQKNMNIARTFVQGCRNKSS